jgi:hypothetical protein
MTLKVLKYSSILFIFFSLESKSQFTTTQHDWLIKPFQQKASIVQKGNRISLDNGLLRREFFVGKNLACYNYLNLSNGQQLLRAIHPEAKLVLNGKMYAVGGMEGQKERAYIRPEWLENMRAGAEDFTFIGFQISDIKPFIAWKRNTWASNHKQATGKQISFEFTSPLAELKGIHVFVNYELIDGLPLLIKWVKIENKSKQTWEVDRVIHEVLGLVEEESAVVGKPEEMKKQHGIYVETNYAFNNAMRYDISDQTTHWKTEPAYTSQVNYNFETPCLLEIYPEKAPGIDLKPGEIFNSPRTHELLMDSYDRQRRGLMIRKMYQKIAPWTTQNPIFMHLISKNDNEVKTAIDQCVATGYEALILSFGSHLTMEDSTADNLIRWKKLADYAHANQILIGGYSLFSSRKISDTDDVIDPKTGKPGGAFFGNAPCFGSPWGLAYRDKIKLFYTKTGFDIWENDGPYPGDVCASTSHPGHLGLKDSQWRQMEIQKELYHWLNEKGVYINAPDWYFLDGTHKIGIGYREVNFSLSRDQQKILNRQNIHDGTIEKTAAMSWGFVPLTAYQGGNAGSVLEPLKDHLKDYHQLMVQYYGAGVQACYRGPRLYDSEDTRVMVKETVDWYKKYREVLNADMIQLRRPDGRDWDGFLHVNPGGKQRGFVMLYNPTNEIMVRKITLPLYYTGISKTAKVTSKEGKTQVLGLSPTKDIELAFTIAPDTYTWFLIE